MNQQTFQTFGKWILSGEHSVLRGVPALVFPLRDLNMTFTYSANPEQAFEVEYTGARGQELQLVFLGLLEEALKKVGRTRSDLRGHLLIDSALPLGAGLGASAALCVGVARLFAHLGYIVEQNMFEFSRGLENLFHGESSGVDVSVALTGEGLKFQRGGAQSPLAIRWKPRLSISYSGKRGVTSDCVKKVLQLKESNPVLFAELDEQMRQATLLAEQALATNEEEGLPLLIDSMNLGKDCFMRWGLCEGALADHMLELKKAGAIAIKPTGSGGGGYVLSLWPEEKRCQAGFCVHSALE